MGTDGGDGHPLHSALYVGTVVHRRVRPVRHHLSYRVFSVLVDLDELPLLNARLRRFGHNRRRAVGFFDRDHGPADGTALKPWIARQLDAAGIAAGGPVRILCFPRLFGYVFNPLSVWFCHATDGALSAVLYEVRNTFGQSHSYLIPAAVGADGLVRQSCEKRFFVSPFMDMETTYNFRVRPPGDRVAIGIHQTDAGGAVLHASLVADRAPLTDAALTDALWRHPLMTIKVMAGIHWEALQLWRKGLRLLPRAPLPATPVTIVPSHPVPHRHGAAP